MDNALVTGGAGFIGSYLVDKLLLDDLNVGILDNLSSGNIEYIKEWYNAFESKVKFLNLDLTIREQLNNLDNYDTIFHLAANPDVRSSSINPEVHLEQNIIATFNILEVARKLDIERFIFTSSSTVYGEAGVTPTPEDYAPLKPISMYGASKLACESIIISYAYTYGFKTVIYRLANVIGGRSNHGVIYDFINKLCNDRTKLEILGNGKQRKSYIHVSDCIEGMFRGLDSDEQVDIFNIGSDDYIDVMTIADVIIDKLGIDDIKFVLKDSGDGRGWKGDVRVMLLDISRLKSLGWRIKYNSLDAVKLTVKEMLEES